MHPCPGNWQAIGHAVVYFGQAAYAFSAGIKCWHCIGKRHNIIELLAITLGRQLSM